MFITYAQGTSGGRGKEQGTGQSPSQGKTREPSCKPDSGYETTLRPRPSLTQSKIIRDGPAAAAMALAQRCLESGPACSRSVAVLKAAVLWQEQGCCPGGTGREPIKRPWSIGETAAQEAGGKAWLSRREPDPEEFTILFIHQEERGSQPRFTLLHWDRACGQLSGYNLL